MADLSLDQPKEQFLEHLFGECEHSSNFKELIAVMANWWPLVIVACLHYRFPPPLHLLEGLRHKTPEPQGIDGVSETDHVEGNA